MIRLLSAVTCGILLAAAPSVNAERGAVNVLVNGGADSGLAGWQGAGVGVLIDDEGIPISPAASRLAVHGPHPLGTPLFAAPNDAAISQVVDFSAYADAIDRGEQRLVIEALLGGRGGQPGGARLVAQALDGAGAPLGEPIVAGPPSERDRQGATMLLDCSAGGRAPIGTRSVRVSLEAIGHGLADSLLLFDGGNLSRPIPAFFSPGFMYVDSDGPGCEQHLEPIPAPPMPALDSLVVMPAALRCGRGALRFRVDRRWRSSVRSLTVRARGKRLVRSAGKPIVIAGPQRTLRVALAITLNDGRRSTGMRTFAPCGPGR